MNLENKPLHLMDSFKGQIKLRINSFLEKHNIHVCLLHANTTDLLQLMHVEVNKPAKDFLKSLGDGTLKKSESNFKEMTSSLLSGNQLIYN